MKIVTKFFRPPVGLVSKIDLLNFHTNQTLRSFLIIAFILWHFTVVYYLSFFVLLVEGVLEFQPAPEPVALASALLPQAHPRQEQELFRGAELARTGRGPGLQRHEMLAGAPAVDRCQDWLLCPEFGQRIGFFVRLDRRHVVARLLRVLLVRLLGCVCFLGSNRRERQPLREHSLLQIVNNDYNRPDNGALAGRFNHYNAWCVSF